MSANGSILPFDASIRRTRRFSAIRIALREGGRYCHLTHRSGEPGGFVRPAPMVTRTLPGFVAGDSRLLRPLLVPGTPASRYLRWRPLGRLARSQASYAPTMALMTWGLA